MQLTRLPALIFCILVQLNVIASFWLTDSTLFQPLAPVQVSAPPIIKTENEPEKARPSDSFETISKNDWLRVDPTKQQLEDCRCNLDWLQNQTGRLLNKWLGSANVVSQMRWLMSNSTGANNNNSEKNRANLIEPMLQQRELAASAGGNNANHWLAWTRKGSGASNNGTRIYAARPAAGVNGKPNGKHQRHALQAKQLQGERGPIGPKGEQGARGEQGERGAPGDAGLISVKDRNSLFDLAGERSSQEGRKHRSLVFIEDEQMLVVSTDSGWRPVQLLSPIRDFRKVIPKFTLSSSEERNRLLASGGSLRMDNSIRPLRRPVVVGASLRALDKDNALDDDDDLFEGGSDNEDSEADEEPDEEVDEDESADDDDEDDDDDDEDTDEEEPIKGNGAKEADRATGRPKERSEMSAISARSAVVHLVSTPIDSFLSAEIGSPASDHASQNKEPSDNRLKLRMIALNEPFSGNVHGIRGADFECKRSAARANIRGSFRAFLASGFQNLNEVVRHNAHRHPIVNLRNEPLANSWNDLFKRPARSANPLARIYSFDGRHVASDSHWPNKLVWHGASSKAGHRGPTLNCDGWHSDSLSKSGYASPIHSPRVGSNGGKRRQKKRHLADIKSEPPSNPEDNQKVQAQGSGSVLDFLEKYPCRMPLIVLCIETVGQNSNSTRTSSTLDNNYSEDSNVV